MLCTSALNGLLQAVHNLRHDLDVAQTLVIHFIQLRVWLRCLAYDAAMGFGALVMLLATASVALLVYTSCWLYCLVQHAITAIAASITFLEAVLYARICALLGYVDHVTTTILSILLILLAAICTILTVRFCVRSFRFIRHAIARLSTLFTLLKATCLNFLTPLRIWFNHVTDVAVTGLPVLFIFLAIYWAAVYH